MEKRDASQRQQRKVAVGYCSCGAAYPSRLQRGGNREARRLKQRAKWEFLRDNQIVSRTLASSLSPSQGGSDSRNPETTGKLQLLQQFPIPGVVDGNSDPSEKDKPIYVGMESHLSRIEDAKTKNQKNKGNCC